MKRPSRVTIEPGFDLGVFVGAVVVHDGVDILSDGNFVLDGVEEVMNS